MNLTIFKKLILGFSIIIILIAGLNIITIRFLTRINEANISLESLIENERIAVQIENAANSINTVVDKLVLKSSYGQDVQPLFGKYEASRIRLTINMEKLENNIDENAQQIKTAWQEVSKNSRDFLTISNSIINLIKNGSIDEAEKLKYTVQYRTSERFMISVEQLLAAYDKLPINSFNEVNLYLKQFRNYEIFLFLAVLIISILVSVLVSRSIVLPIRKLQEEIKIIGQGDLNHKAPIYGSLEVRQLAISFNNMVTNLKLVTASRNELEKVNKALESSNKDLQDFTFIASHDLQEPLRKIMSFDDRLKVKFSEQLDPKARDYLDRMHRAAERMRNLIEDLLTYSQISIEVRPFENVNINEQIDIILSYMETAIKDINAKIEIDELPVVYGDKVQIRQLFFHLLENSFKFKNTDKQPHINIKSIDKKNAFHIIKVIDNGIGFDLQYADKIFIPFQRLHNRLEYKGSGIGLAICKKIVERHGGQITVTSSPGEGAEFTIKLPLKYRNGS